MKATEDGHCQYLYIKDKTWTVVGLAENEAVPEKAMTVEEVNRRYKVGERDKHKGAAGKSQAVVEGLDVCFYPIVESLDAPRPSARHINWIEGGRLAFGFFEVPGGYDEPETTAGREMFFYILSGRLHAKSGEQTQRVSSGDIIHVPRGMACRLQVESDFARYVLVCSTPYLENRIDNMTPDEAEQARLHVNPN